MTTASEQSRPAADEEGYPAPFSFWTRKNVIEMNIRFAKAMLAARQAKLERFTVGVIKDATPMVPSSVSRMLTGSALSSSAAMCAEDETAGHAPRGRAFGRG